MNWAERKLTVAVYQHNCAGNPSEITAETEGNAI